MSPQEFIDLYEKYLSGNCTPEEINQLEVYRDNFELKDLPWSDGMGNREEVRLDILYNLNHNITTPKKSFKRYWVAAAAILVFALGLIWMAGYRNHNTSTEIVKNSSVGVKGPVIPGNNKATLTLSDGSNIDLTDSKKGLLSKQGSVAVGKSGEGEIVYDAKQAEAKGAVTLYNMISTPRGGQYQVVLSDGTKVWLNAASSLTYPTAFTGVDRSVQLNGEAYFEVADSKDKPFKVMVGDMQIVFEQRRVIARVAALDHRRRPSREVVREMRARSNPVEYGWRVLRIALRGEDDRGGSVRRFPAESIGIDRGRLVMDVGAEIQRHSRPHRPAVLTVPVEEHHRLFGRHRIGKDGDAIGNSVEKCQRVVAKLAA